MLGILSNLPLSVLIRDVTQFLEPKDTLALAMTCKTLHAEIFAYYPKFRLSYGVGNKVASCMQKMVTFVQKNNAQSASWGFTYKQGGKRNNGITRTFAITKPRKGFHRYCFMINDARVRIDADVAFEWFRTNMLTHWAEITLQIKCNLKHADRQVEFIKITQEIYSCKIILEHLDTEHINSLVTYDG